MENQDQVAGKTILRSRDFLSNAMSPIRNGASVPKIYKMGKKRSYSLNKQINTKQDEQERPEDFMSESWRLVC